MDDHFFFWRLWIDTGGTFTDGIAISPGGAWHRVKVLSSGHLRATLTRRVGPACYALLHRWPAEVDIFAGYQLALLGSPIQARVIRVDLQAGLLYTDHDFALDAPASCELSAGEEAPLLAARLATSTPLHQALPPMEVRLGSTKGTNALLERKGEPVSLIITRGFADLPYIGTQQRPHLFQLDIPEPGFLPAQTIEVDERISAQGVPLQALSQAAIEQAVAQVQHQSVAVALLHAYRNPIHEQQLGQALEAAGIPFISLSSQLSPLVKLLPRTQTAIVNAYLAPIIHRYLDRIAAGLSARAGAGFLVMGSSGGLTPYAQYQPKDSLLSGPAGGVVGAAQTARQLGFDRILTLDMGGTSTDTARYDQGFDYRFGTDIDGIQLLAPALAIETVAAGGGSICDLRQGRLVVGPHSAGASPGPACYGAGGPLTITDVNLLLGKLDPRLMGIPISRQAAESALEAIRQRLSAESGHTYSAQELLQGYERIANELMADAIRRISVARGFDPRQYALLAFGGAGGLHACAIADMLGIDTVILPAEAGLLSAYGMGHAQVERVAERQILEPLHEVQAQLPHWRDALSQQAGSQLLAEGFEAPTIRPSRCLLFVRLRGQESSLELDYQPELDVAQAFEQQYRKLFGHYPAQQVIEVESLRVFMAAQPPTDAPPTATLLAHEAPAHDQVADSPQPTLFYRWHELQAGAQLAGAAVLAGPHATAYLPGGWALQIQAGGHALARKQAQEVHTPASAPYSEAAELSLFTHRFAAIAEEMGAQLQRTAFSVNVKERLDFSCALLDAQARLLVNAPHIPVHLGSLGVCARLCLQHLPIEPGDVVVVNHPKYGGSHLPDITLMQGVFMPNGQLIGYVINRAHHAEVGGKRPGSMPPDATCLAEEGVVFGPTYLIKGGEAQWTAIQQRLSAGPWPSRTPHENLADLNAALASLRTGADALQRLAAAHSVSKLHHYMALLQADANRQLWLALTPWMGQTLHAQEQLDDGHLIQVEIQLLDAPTQLRIDFTGSSGRHPGNLNANVSIVFSAIIYVLRLLCGGDTPLNEGLLQHLSLRMPHDSFLHPDFADDPLLCPAVVGGNTEVSQRLVDTLLKAFGLAAASQGTMNNFLFGNSRFGYYETIGGGAGAGPGFKGRSGVHQHMTNTRITDPEDLERRYPVRLRQFALRRGSGGRGLYPGGDGLIRELEALEPLSVTLLSQRRTQGPYGLAGGEAGLPGQQYLLLADGSQQQLPGLVAVELAAGDVIRLETPGGGGWGSPSS